MKIISWYKEKSQRDQKAIQILTVFLGLSCLYLFWSSLNSTNQSMAEDLNYYQELNSWIQKNKPLLIQGKKATKKPISGSLFSHVEQSFQGLSSETVKVELKSLSNGEVSVRINQVSFKTIVSKIKQAGKKGFTIKRFEANKTDKPGWVQVLVIFKQ